MDVFLHIPKTGGSTVWSILYQQYGADRALRVAPAGQVQENGRLVREILERRDGSLELVGGHFFLNACEDLLEHDVRLFTFLREPVNRAVSQYYFILRFKEHRRHAEFVDQHLSLEQGLSRLADNVQVRHLASCDPDKPCRREHLETAQKNLANRFCVVGLTERFDESLVLLRRALGWRMPWYVPTNVGTNRPREVPSAARDIARNRDSLDIELYEFGKQLLRKQIRRQGAGFPLEVALFRRCNLLLRLRKETPFLEAICSRVSNRLRRFRETARRAGRRPS